MTTKTHAAPDHNSAPVDAMMLALAHRQMVRRLVIMDIAHIAYGHDQTRYIDAMEGLDLTRIERRSQADTALADKKVDIRF